MQGVGLRIWGVPITPLGCRRDVRLVSTVTSVNRGSTFALRRAMFNFYLGRHAKGTLNHLGDEVKPHK